jgi:hypothetical protein
MLVDGVQNQVVQGRLDNQEPDIMSLTVYFPVRTSILNTPTHE